MIHPVSKHVFFNKRIFFSKLQSVQWKQSLWNLCIQYWFCHTVYPVKWFTLLNPFLVCLLYTELTFSILKSLTWIWLPIQNHHPVIGMFSFCHWLAVIVVLPCQSMALQSDLQFFTLIPKARLCFRQVFDVRDTQCSSQRRNKMSGKASKIGADWQLGGSQKPLRKTSLSINLVMRSKWTPVDW